MKYETWEIKHLCFKLYLKTNYFKLNLKNLNDVKRILRNEDARNKL
jgi:hypothetical protein